MVTEKKTPLVGLCQLRMPLVRVQSMHASPLMPLSHPRGQQLPATQCPDQEVAGTGWLLVPTSPTQQGIRSEGEVHSLHHQGNPKPPGNICPTSPIFHRQQHEGARRCPARGV